MKYIYYYNKISKRMFTTGQIVNKVYENDDAWIFIGSSSIPNQIIYGNTIVRVMKKNGKILPFPLFTKENNEIIKKSKVIYDYSKNAKVEKKDNRYVIRNLN